MLLRGGLTIKGIHDIERRIPSLYLISILNSQNLARSQSVEKLLSFINGRVACLWVNVALIQGWTTEGIENPPVDIIVNGCRVRSPNGYPCIVVLSLVEHVEPFAARVHRCLDTIDGAADGTIVRDVILAFLATLGGDEDDT